MQGSFITTYERYQKNSVRIAEHSNFSTFINSFKSSELNQFLEILKQYDKTTDYIQMDNFLDIINNDQFTKKLKKKDKEKIIEKVYEYLKNAASDDKLLRYRLHTLLRTYIDVTELKQVQNIFKIDLLKRSNPSYFMEYFRTYNQPKNYQEAVIKELEKEKKEGQVQYFYIMEEDLSYIKNNDAITKNLLNYLKIHTNIAVLLLNQRSSTYSKGLSTSAFDFFSSLNDSNHKLLEVTIIEIIHTYIVYRDKGLYDEYREIEEFLRSNLFQKMIDMLTIKNASIIKKILNFFNDKHQFFDAAVNVFIYGLHQEDIKGFIDHPVLENRNFFSVYHGIAQSNRSDKNNLIKEFKKYKKDLIEQNEAANKKFQQEEKDRLAKKESELRTEIEHICNLLQHGGFSEKLLYLYEQNPNSFLDAEKDIVIEQIEKILGDTRIFTPEKGKVSYTRKEQGGNTFTYPGYIPTLERCITLGEKLGINLKQFQQKLIYLLPFAYKYELILDKIDKLDDADIEYLLKVYHPNRDKTDDLRLFQSGNFFQVCKKYKEQLLKNTKYSQQVIKNLITFLIAPSIDVHIWLKKEILTLIGPYVGENFFGGKKGSLTEYIEENNLHTYHYFNDFLSGGISDDNDREKYELRTIANQILIDNYSKKPLGKEAIERRLHQLKTINVVVNPSPVGVVYSPTPLMEEVEGWRDSSNFLHPLKNVLKHPDSKDEINDILENSFKLWLSQNTNIVISYIQDFCAWYYKQGNDDDLINLKNSIKDKDGSDSFLKWHFPKLLQNLSNDHIEIFDLKDVRIQVEEEKKKYKKSLEEIQEREKLSSGFYKGRLFVEGSTDKIIIETAWNQLYPGKSIPLKIGICGGCSTATVMIASMIEEMADNINLKTFWLVDRDSSGMSVWKRNDYSKYFASCNKLNLKRIESKKGNLFIKSCDIEHKSDQNKMDHHILLLPIPKLLTYLVEKPSFGTTPISTSGSILENTHGQDAKLTIEHLLYYDGINGVVKKGDGNGYFIEIDSISSTPGVKYLIFKGDKRKFAETVANDPSICKNSRENFMPIFQYIGDSL